MKLNKEILISVVMPVFKTKKDYLEQSVNSILNQTYRKFEFLIIYEQADDDDNLEEYLNSFSDPRIRVIKTPIKYGLPRSLNIGMNEAKGKYIARMDSDDVSNPRRFEKQLIYMEQHPDVVVLGTDIEILGKASKRRQYVKVEPDTRAIRMLFYNAGIAHPTGFLRRKFFEDNNIRYNEEILGAEDYHLWVDVTILGGIIHHLDEKLLSYRLSDSQASVRHSGKVRGWEMIAKGKLLDVIGDFSDDDKEILGSWNKILLKASIEDIIVFLNKILEENKKSKFFKQEKLKKELAFRYLMKAIILYRHGNDASMLDWKYIKQMRSSISVTYIFKNMMRILLK